MITNLVGQHVKVDRVEGGVYPVELPICPINGVT